jgi:hypothetical protein
MDPLAHRLDLETELLANSAHRAGALARLSAAQLHQTNRLLLLLRRVPPRPLALTPTRQRSLTPVGAERKVSESETTTLELICNGNETIYGLRR